MNPFFVILVILGAVILWFSINSFFPLIGKIICGLWEETKYNMTDNNDNNE